MSSEDLPSRFCSNVSQIRIPSSFPKLIPEQSALNILIGMQKKPPERVCESIPMISEELSNPVSLPLGSFELIFMLVM
jgi:hypothetical protein